MQATFLSGAHSLHGVRIRGLRAPLASCLTMLVGLSACGRPVSSDTALGAGTCRLAVEGPDRIVLANGSRLLVDPTSVVVSGEAVLVLGSNVALLSDSDDSDVWRDDPVGALRHAGGELTLVPTPLPGAQIREPRAARAAGGGWHVLFATGTRSERDLIAYDTASIWYAHYDGQTWSGTQQVARVLGARLSRQIASELVVHRGEPAFAFPYDRSAELQSNAAGNQGVVLLARRNGEWSVDTLSTWEAPASVKLTPYGSRTRAILAMSYFVDGRPRGPGIFTADYTETWGEPRLVYDPAPNKVNSVIMTLGDVRARAVTWITDDFEADAERLEWAALDEDGVHRRSTVTTAPDLFGTAMVEVDDRITAWLVRDGGSDRRLGVYVADDGNARLIDVLEIPLMNFYIPAVPLGGGRILAITGGPDPTPGAEPPFSSYFTEIAVRCARDRN